MQKLLIAVVVLAVLLGVAFWQFNLQKTRDQGDSMASVKLVKLDSALVDELEINAPDKDHVTLEKRGEQWHLKAPVDALANQGAVETALSKLSELEVVGVAATKDKTHELLEVDEKKGVRVTAKQAGKVLLDIVIGRYRSGNTMVRNQGETPVATAKGSMKFAFNKLIKEWRDRTVTKVDVKDVTAIAFENLKGSLRFNKLEDAWVQAKGGKSIKDFDPNKVKSVVATATSLRASDFAASDVSLEQAGVGADAPAKVTLTLAEGAEPLVLLIGNKKPSGYHLRRQGVDTIFIVSNYIGDRLLADAESFQKTKAPAPTSQSAAGTELPSNIKLPDGVKLPPGFKLPPGADVRTRESFEAERNK